MSWVSVCVTLRPSYVWAVDERELYMRHVVGAPRYQRDVHHVFEVYRQNGHMLHLYHPLVNWCGIEVNSYYVEPAMRPEAFTEYGRTVIRMRGIQERLFTS